VIRLPGDERWMVVDAKFPLEAFNALKAASGETNLRNAETRLRADVMKHVKDISEKYLLPGETHETAIMFVPSESVYAELYEKFEDVIQYKKYTSSSSVVHIRTVRMDDHETILLEFHTNSKILVAIRFHYIPNL
jgi:DNA anti-recombination protein RmuC